MRNDLNIAHVTACCGLPAPTLMVWIANKVITPVGIGGKGKGKVHQFSTIQVLALCYARLSAAEGVNYNLLRRIVAIITSYSEEELLAEFKTGRKFLLVTPAIVCLIKRPTSSDASRIVDLWFWYTARYWSNRGS